MEIFTKHRFFFFQAIGVIAGVLFIVSCIVHFATYLSTNALGKYPFLFLLHIFIFILLGAVVVFNKIENKTEDEKFVSLVAAQNEDETNANESLIGFDIPHWLKILGIILGVYIVVNIISGLTLEGNPAIVEGKYVLVNHGVVRELSRAEYDAATARSLRQFSGHWLLFYFFISAVSFLESFKKKRSARHYEHQNKADFAELIFKISLENARL